MDKTGLPIVYNEKRLQKSAPHINTCGRWVLARLWLSDMVLEDFQKIFNHRNSDELVTRFTDQVIKEVF